MSRKFSAVSSSNDGAPGSSSQDGYDSRFPQKESNRRHWSCSLSSSRFPLTRTSGDRGDVFTQSRKVKVIDVDAEPYGSCSTRGLEVFEISDEDFQISKKMKKADFDPFEYNSSEEELEGIAAPPQRKGATDTGAFDFSEDQDLWKSEKWSDAGPFSLNSSQELSDMGIPRSIKHGWKEMILEPDVVSVKSKKKNKVKDGALEKKTKKKKQKKKRESRESRESGPVYIDPTTTLVEIQESGETTERLDEVNFALDGLNKGQPARARRASLISLLSICGTLQQRRRLWTYGLARKIVDSILELDLDDKPSNLAAAALFYLLTSDGQDEHLLYSPNSICFLVKLLKPLSPAAGKDKSQPIGSKLISLCKNAGYSQGSAKGTDSISTGIMHKVREILVNCKEMKPIDDSDGGKQEAELNPLWISLLTIEKACSSSISIEGFEDTRRTSRRAGANFKEKFRESGGLDAVFEVARKCHFVMEEWLEKSPSFALDSKNISGLESLVLLLKCLKIMENATFLSNNNQSHLLGMKGSFGGQQAPRFFTKLILSVIKILSGVTLLRSSLMSSQDEKMGCVSGGHCSTERASYESLSHCDPCLTSGQPRLSLSGQPRLSLSAVGASQVSLQKWRFESSQEGLCSRTSCSSNSATHVSRDDSGVEFDIGNQKLMFTNSGITENSLDPFGFDDDDFEPSKWDSLSGSVNKCLSLDWKAAVGGYIDTSDFVPASQQESNNVEYYNSQETSCSSAADEDKSNLLADCLLTAIKVLMNLCNDNLEGCQQIASSGGLEILSSLIAGHFPSFSLRYARDDSLSSKSSLTVHERSNTPLTDQKLDFLVAILGLLVNLVEKDVSNRSRLAGASISLPNHVGLNSKEQSNLIPILCSIFLANQGTTETDGEEKNLSWEDEEAILQGEKEAEKMIIEAYAALLLAFLSTESKKVRRAIAERLPSRNLKILVPVLERFVEFHLTLNVISPETHSAVLEVIESCRMP